MHLVVTLSRGRLAEDHNVYRHFYHERFAKYWGPTAKSGQSVFSPWGRPKSSPPLPLRDNPSLDNPPIPC
jgi:hypothetical protein